MFKRNSRKNYNGRKCKNRAITEILCIKNYFCTDNTASLQHKKCNSECPIWNSCHRKLCLQEEQQQNVHRTHKGIDEHHRECFACIFKKKKTLLKALADFLPYIEFFCRLFNPYFNKTCEQEKLNERRKNTS